MGAAFSPPTSGPTDARRAAATSRPAAAWTPLTAENVQRRGQYMKMAGREVFKAAVLAMAEACDEALRRAGVTADDIDLLIPHQANLRIIEATAKHAGIPMDKVMVNVDRYGNTSSASIPLALAQAEEEGRLKPGMLVLLVAFGAGFTWGARSSGGDGPALPGPGRAEGRHGQGSRRAVSRRARHLRRHR